MNNKDLLNQKVTHINMGNGVIKSVEDNVMVVRFDNKRECKFSYPSAFRTFLSAEDEKLCQMINDDLQGWLISSGTLVREEIKAKTAETQKEINAREVERQKQRIERAKAEASRSRFFAGLDVDNPNK